MAFQDEDFLDEANLIDIPCEFCNDLFPMILLMEHQTACRPDLVRFVEPTVEELEAQFSNLEDNQGIQDSKDEEKVKPPIDRNWISIAEVPAITVSKEKDQLVKFANDEEDLQAIEKALLEEKEAFPFGSLTKEKSDEKEKLSFKYPPNPLLNNKGSKNFIQNDLTESDNEDNESLEEFWKRANIKLVQRKRMLQNKTSKLQ